MRVTNIHIFFFNDTATTEIYTLSLHDALPIWRELSTSLHFASSRFFSWKRLLAGCLRLQRWRSRSCSDATSGTLHSRPRSEEHTSELQSRLHLVCRLLLEKENRAARGPVSIHL